jgi:hypothetical protein
MARLLDEHSPELLGTIPGWITSAGVIAILGIVVRWQLGLRKLSIAAQQVDVNADRSPQPGHR